MNRTLPYPGARQIQNLVATLILHGNTQHTLDLDRIAHWQGHDPADLRAEFARQLTLKSTAPSNSFEIPEGK